MQETRYMISDASKMIDVEPHVLRYWQEELGLDIPRNEMGHRHYRQEDIELLKSVKTLRDKGFQLKAIKLLIPKMHKVKELDAERLSNLRDKLEVALGLVDVKGSEARTEKKSIDHKLPAEEISDSHVKNESEVKSEFEAKSKSEPESGSEANVTDITKEEKEETDSEVEKAGKMQSVPLEAVADRKPDSLTETKEWPLYKKKQEFQLQGQAIAQDEADSGAGCLSVRECEQQTEEGGFKELEKEKSIAEGMLNQKEGQEGQEALQHTESMDDQNEQEVISKAGETRPAAIPDNHELATDRQNGDKVIKFQQIMKEIMADAMKENSEQLTAKMTVQMTDAITETMIKELDYHMRMREEREEERFKQLDRTIREFQQQRQQVAATKDTKKKESKFFKKNKKRV